MMPRFNRLNADSTVKDAYDRATVTEVHDLVAIFSFASVCVVHFFLLGAQTGYKITFCTLSSDLQRALRASGLNRREFWLFRTLARPALLYLSQDAAESFFHAQSVKRIYLIWQGFCASAPFFHAPDGRARFLIADCGIDAR